MADGTHSDAERCKAAGRAVKYAIEAESGHIYEKWRKGMIRAATGEWD